MSEIRLKNENDHVVNKVGYDLSKFQEILRKNCQQRMRERRGQLFNKGRSGLLSAEDVQETLIEIVRQEFNNLATSEKSDTNFSTQTIINRPSNQEEALQEESDILAEQEQWIMEEYERLKSCEEQMFDMLEDEVSCPMCHRSFLEEIPDFISCNYCGLKIRTEISLRKFKYNLEMYVNMHSESCLKVPSFSLVSDGTDTSLSMSCTACSNFYLIRTVEKY